MLLYFAIFRLDGSDNRMHFKIKEINSISRMMQIFTKRTLDKIQQADMTKTYSKLVYRRNISQYAMTIDSKPTANVRLNNGKPKASFYD